MKFIISLAMVFFLNSTAGASSDDAASSDDELQRGQMNFVMATDENYLIPTFVTIYSIIQNNPEKLLFVVFTKGDGEWLNKFKIMKKNLISKEDRVKIEAIPIEAIENDDKVGSTYGEVQGKVADLDRQPPQPLKLLALRPVLPLLWQNASLCNVPKCIWRIQQFLWIDSDIVVTQDLREFYYGLFAKHPDQPLISSNLGFISRRSDREGNPYNFGGEVGLVKSDPGGEGSEARVSGGVVAWNLSWFTTKHVERQPRQKSGENIISYCIRMVSPSGTEELILDKMLGCAKKIVNEEYFYFSTRYNCRSAYVDAAKQFLQDKTLKMSNAAREDLQAISEGRVAIWHWDYERKPWDYGSEETVGFPEALWWAYLRDLASKLDAAGLEIITSWRPNYQLCGLLRVSEAGLAISSNPRIPANGFFIGLGSSSRKILRSTSMPNIRPKSALK